MMMMMMMKVRLRNRLDSMLFVCLFVSLFHAEQGNINVHSHVCYSELSSH